MNRFLSIFARVVLWVATVYSLSPRLVQAAGPNEDTGDNGLKIATQGAANGVTACAGCHGPHGEGNATANFPRIAGQPAAYLANQLKSFTDGRRNNPVMSLIAKAMTPRQIEAVSSYYAALATATPAPAPPATAALTERGKTLATLGDNHAGIQGCANCHGPGGSGEGPTYPALAGQLAAYLQTALAAWKNGTRTTDPSRQMNLIAKRLNDQDIAAIAAYYASLPAPPPAAQRTNVPADSAIHPAASSPPTPQSATPSQPVKGIGTEQGAPTTGGAQGPGGGGGANGAGPAGSPSGKTP